MGTSSMYSGPKDNKLLPDDYLGIDKDDEKEEKTGDDKKIDSEAWKKAKNAMSKYINAKNGNRQKVIKRYVSANGGSNRVAKSSTSGVKGVSGLGGLLNKISSSGLENTLREYKIEYKDKSINSIFSEFINILSPNANTKEEVAGRDALIETLTELYELIETTGEDITYFDNLDDSKFNFIMNKYIENYVFAKFLNDLEYRAEKYAKSIESVIQKEKDIKDFINYSVNNATKDINFKSFNYNDLDAIEKIYRDCYKIWEDE